MSEYVRMYMCVHVYVYPDIHIQNVQWHMKLKYKETEDATNKGDTLRHSFKRGQNFSKNSFFYREHLILAFGYFSIANIRISFAA